MFETRLLQYHQNAMLVTNNPSFTGFGQCPATHVRTKCAANKTDTKTAAPRITFCPSCTSDGGINGPPHMEDGSSVSLSRYGESATAVPNQIRHMAKSSRRVSVSNVPVLAS